VPPPETAAGFPPLADLASLRVSGTASIREGEMAGAASPRSTRGVAPDQCRGIPGDVPPRLVRAVPPIAALFLWVTWTRPPRGRGGSRSRGEGRGRRMGWCPADSPAPEHFFFGIPLSGDSCRHAAMAICCSGPVKATALGAVNQQSLLHECRLVQNSEDLTHFRLHLAATSRLASLPRMTPSPSCSP
jgi:hypothetical protein